MEGKLKFIDLFAGIGGCRIAFESLGCECIWSCDWDTDAQKTYEKNFGDRPVGDIKKVDNAEIPEHDILVAGFPCPSFSIIGGRKGLADHNGSLFFEIVRILKAKQPTGFLLENVRDLGNHNQGKTLNIILQQLTDANYHVHYKVLNALDFGLAQNRKRIIFVGFRDNLEFSFPKGTKERKSLKDILEPDEQVPKQYWASDRIKERRAEFVKMKGKEVFYPSIWHENKGGNIGIHPYSCALRAGASYNYLLVNGVRRLTPLEMLRLQGFPDDYKIEGSTGAIRKMLGNSVPVPMIRSVAVEMLKSLEQRKVKVAIKQPTLLEVANDVCSKIGTR